MRFPLAPPGGQQTTRTAHRGPQFRSADFGLVPVRLFCGRPAENHGRHWRNRAAV